jgi:hypothetical protein
MVRREDRGSSRTSCGTGIASVWNGHTGLFEACVGRVFPIAGIDNELLERHVGEVVGEENYTHSIWIEANCVLLLP